MNSSTIKDGAAHPVLPFMELPLHRAWSLSHLSQISTSSPPPQRPAHAQVLLDISLRISPVGPPVSRCVLTHRLFTHMFSDALRRTSIC